MPDDERPKTMGELRESGYRLLTVREELRKNLIKHLERGDRIFPGIVGFEETVIPQMENAILAGQNLILLGERGQAKSRIIRQMVTLLDEEVPYITGCEVNDSPYSPICRQCKDKVASDGDAVEIGWLPRERRYGEKLATPDISVADLIGEIEPIKVAEGRYLADELTIHFGLIPRTNRGIFCISRTFPSESRSACSTSWKRETSDQGLPRNAAPGRVRGGQCQPGGLHQPRENHHAPKGPVWRTNPYSLSQALRAGARDCRAGVFTVS